MWWCGQLVMWLIACMAQNSTGGRFHCWLVVWIVQFLISHWQNWLPPHQLNFVPCKQPVMWPTDHNTYINRTKTEQNTSLKVPWKMLASLVVKRPGAKQQAQTMNCCQNSSMYLRISHLLFIAKQFSVFVHICLLIQSRFPEAFDIYFAGLSLLNK